MENIENNGLVLDSHFLPTEVIALILSYVPPCDLKHTCRFVCKIWNELITDDVSDVWKFKTRRSRNITLLRFSDIERMRLKFPWYVWYSIHRFNPFEKNLLRNNCGQNKMKYWIQDTNDQFKIEKEPTGADPLPDCEDFGGHTSCFATTYRLCKKKQTIDLFRRGLSQDILDRLQPKIIASEWFAGRFDCGSRYHLKVSLLSSNNQCIQEKEELRTVIQWEGSKWEKVTIEFENYGPHVRYVEFEHSGKDTQFWAGYYGSKMTGGVVKVAFPISSSS